MKRVLEELLSAAVVGMLLSFLAFGLPRVAVGLAVMLGEMSGDPVPEGAFGFAFGSAFIAMILSFMIARFVAMATKEKTE